jgi:site-specific recombinase XerD
MNQSTNQGRRYSEFDHVQERLIAVATNPRDKAFIALLARSGVRISEAV